MDARMDHKVRGKFSILVGIDFSENGARVLQSAADLAFTTPEAELHLVHAFGPAVPGDRLGSFEVLSELASIDDSDAAADALHQLATSMSSCADRVCAYVQEGSATSVIARVADDIEADLIVVGSHDHTTVNPAFFGSVAEKLVRTAPCPVLIVRRKAISTVHPVPPVCPACEASKRLTWGARDRCLDHTLQQTQSDASVNGPFLSAMAPAN